MDCDTPYKGYTRQSLDKGMCGNNDGIKKKDASVVEFDPSVCGGSAGLWKTDSGWVLSKERTMVYVIPIGQICWTIGSFTAAQGVVRRCTGGYHEGEYRQIVGAFPDESHTQRLNRFERDA